MTTQEAYELMRVYLTRPGARRAANEGTCQYEAVMLGEVHRCAVGCLLSPETLNQTRYISEEFAEDAGFDDTTQVGMHVRLADLRGGLATIHGLEYVLPELDEVDFDFLEGAQYVHDNKNNWKGGKFDVVELDKLAGRHGLTVVSDKPVREAPRELISA
jgi:hypothetical protein